MAKIAEIVTYINNTLKGGQLSDARFKKGSWNAIAELSQINENETCPIIPAVKGNSTKIMIDDVFPFFIYHRITGQSFSTADDFGYNTRIESYNIQLIVFGNRESLQLTREQIMTAISLGFPFEMPKATRSALSLEQVAIEPTGWNTDRESVYRQEYGNAPFQLKPQHIFLSLGYTVQTWTKTTCIEIC